MAAVEITIAGTLYDRLNRTTQQVVLIGEASLTGLTVGGGPIVPPPGGGEPPLGIWGPGDPRPTNPIAGFDPIHGTWPDRPTPVPPDVEIPPPGSPPVMIGGTQPVHPIVPPPAIVVNYPGVGKVLVPLPVATSGATPPASGAPPA